MDVSLIIYYLILNVLNGFQESIWPNDEYPIGTTQKAILVQVKGNGW